MKHFLEKAADLLIEYLDQAADKTFVRKVVDILSTEFATFPQKPVHASEIFNAVDDCLAMLISFKYPKDHTDIDGDKVYLISISCSFSKSICSDHF